MKILYTTEYSGPNICGVWTRVKNEIEYMAKQGHQIIIFSTDINKDGGSLLPYERMAENIHVYRFKPMFRLSENASWWANGDFKEKIKALSPDIIICNTYRHLETSVCLDIAEKLNIPCCLVTHAPFLESGVRSKALSVATWLYDRLFCRLNQFSKIFAISKWEIPYLLNLGAKNEKIIYVPNALPNKLLESDNKAYQKGNKLLFLGRITPIKDIPTLLNALSLGSSEKRHITLAGPIDKEYKKKLNQMYKHIDWHEPIYDIDEKIKLIEQHDIFILPSKREGMPQALLEAMARGKIIISSRNQGALEIVNGTNGFLFDIGNPEQLYKQLCQINSMTEEELQRISESARQTAMEFAASKIYPRTEEIYLSLISNKNK